MGEDEECVGSIVQEKYDLLNQDARATGILSTSP